MFDKIFENNEIIKSVKDSIDDKATSPIYGVFIISWIIFHWKLVYTAIFIGEEKIWEATGGMLKSDYLAKTFFNFSNLEFYVLWAMPLLFTWLFIWKFPKWISIPAFEKSQEFDTEKLEIKLKNKINLLEKQLKYVDVIEQKTKKERLIKEQEKEIKKIDPTADWLRELNSVIVDEKDIRAIREGNKVIYETNGRFVSNPNNARLGYSTYISSASLSRLDALGLIGIISDKRDVMEFTGKGKFFIRELQKKDIL